jgi:hypothetical protein
VIIKLIPSFQDFGSQTTANIFGNKSENPKLAARRVSNVFGTTKIVREQATQNESYVKFGCPPVALSPIIHTARLSCSYLSSGNVSVLCGCLGEEQKRKLLMPLIFCLFCVFSFLFVLMVVESTIINTNRKEASVVVVE